MIKSSTMLRGQGRSVLQALLQPRSSRGHNLRFFTGTPGEPRVHRVALLPGDGIGMEVIPQGLRVLTALADKYDFTLETKEYPYGCDYYQKHGVMMPEEGFKLLKNHDAILLGAVGDPTRVPDHVSLRGLLVPIRQRFDLFVNLRPSSPIPGVPTPLARNPQFDIAVVRENSEGEYIGAGGRMKKGTKDEVAIQTAIFTRKGVERIIRYSFELAMTRKQKLASASKSNAMQHAYVMWEEVLDDIATEYPTVEVTKFHADALAALMVRSPESLDVVVASNLLGDILTDLAGALQGSLGIPASANINPNREYPGLFEPVHGSAPDIVGRNIANPIATVWAIAMMLDYLGEMNAAKASMEAVERVTSTRGPEFLTPDLGGSANMTQMVDSIIEEIEAGEA